MKVFILGLIAGAMTMTAAADDLKPYPPAEDGAQRMVFRVPAVDNEADRMVEVLVGKVMEVDCNRIMMGGKLVRHTVKGWGYSYFTAEIPPHHGTTMMACPPEQKKTNKFIAATGEGFRIRYNSKLPVVVYAPDGYEVRYRIWSASEEVGHAAAE